MRQLNLFQTDFSEIVQKFAGNTAEKRGAIFTKPEIVDFILDLSGYTSSRDLSRHRILEPSFGDGDFLISIVDRLLRSYISFSPTISTAGNDLADAIRAFEINNDSIKKTTDKLIGLLQSYDLPHEASKQLLEKWIICNDFLLTDLPFKFSYVVGNPPYVRQERIPDLLMREYRSRFATIYDRADLYIPFIEKCLVHLEPDGVMGFICSDRWMKNRYGGPLRAMVAKDYHIRCYVDMVDTPAFASDVIAYPAITVIQRHRAKPTRISIRPQVHPAVLSKLAHALNAKEIPDDSNVFEADNVANGSDPWVFQAMDRLKVVRRLESSFPVIEETGCKIGIGVATGADSVFIGKLGDLPVEPDRRIPLVKTKDIENGIVNWQGLAVINPFEQNGKLVSLVKYPLLAEYFRMHAGKIRKRNCAKRNPKGWYRTIDRIYPDLASKPKLLIPDIKGDAHIVYENGQYYPHHNLYYVLSENWDLKALKTVLQSGIAKLFVSVYSTKMRGGYFRFQAQYLRRIRLPHWQDVPLTIRDALISNANSKNARVCNEIVSELYQLSGDERAALMENNEGQEPDEC